MKTHELITQEAFDSFLRWLDADRERAGSKYESIRLRLIKIFHCRGCSEAEDLTDETINRVIGKVDQLTQSYRGDPALYFYGVARNIHLEYLRKPRVPEASLQRVVANDMEEQYQCLERCMENLPAEKRRLISRYYQHEKGQKIQHRKLLARELDLPLNALRIRAHRIRLALQKCVDRCVGLAIPQ